MNKHFLKNGRKREAVVSVEAHKLWEKYHGLHE